MQSLKHPLMEASVPLVLVEKPRLRAVGIHEFMSMEIPPRETVLDPILKVGGLGMCYAPRGIGKTFFSLSFAYPV